MTFLNSKLNTQKDEHKGRKFLEQHPPKEMGLRSYSMIAETEKRSEKCKQNKKYIHEGNKDECRVSKN